MKNAQEPAGYRVDFKQCDPVYMTPADYARDCAAGYDGGDVWPLFVRPQPECPKEIEVYHGWCWLRPEHASAVRSLEGFVPLYLGPQIQHAPIDEVVLHAFPSVVERRLQTEHPHLTTVPVVRRGSAAHAIREQARKQSERGNHTAAERLWDAAKTVEAADGVRVPRGETNLSSDADASTDANTTSPVNPAPMNSEKGVES